MDLYASGLMMNMHMLGAYVGWNMKYQIESTSEAYLGEDEYVWKTWQ